MKGTGKSHDLCKAIRVEIVEKSEPTNRLNQMHDDCKNTPVDSLIKFEM